MSDREYTVLLYSFIKFGPARTNLLKSYFGTAKKAWNALNEDLVEIGLNKTLAREFTVYRDTLNAKNYFNSLKRNVIDYVVLGDDDYPENLLDLPDAPHVLYLRGKILPTDQNAVAIVGTRKMTSYGKEVATHYSSRLSDMGIAVVSGLAIGIDAAAHKGTLAAGGRCIAVMPSGLDSITPRSNMGLARDIVKNKGLIVSEMPLGSGVFRSSFPMRNRIISGLSKAVVVVEGAEKSGTLLTASAAAEQGRQVFAVPGQVTSPMSGAPHFLIKNGAKIAFSVEDVVEELNMQLNVDTEKIERVMPKDKNEAKLLDILSVEPLHLDEIARISSLKVPDVSARLTVMELKGLVVNIGRGIYKKTT